MAFVFYWDVSVFKFFHNIKFVKDEQNVEEGLKRSEKSKTSLQEVPI